MTRGVYLDSSALVKLAIPEPESRELRRYLANRRPRVTSALATVEVTQALRRVRASSMDARRQVLRNVQRVAVNQRVLDAAAALDLPGLRSLDAIHVATALLLGDDLATVVTYDTRMAEAATSMSLRVATPS